MDKIKQSIIIWYLKIIAIVSTIFLSVFMSVYIWVFVAQAHERGEKISGLAGGALGITVTSICILLVIGFFADEMKD